MTAPAEPAQDEIDRDDAIFYEGLAVEEFAKGNTCWALYFLDAADFHYGEAGPPPEVVSQRIELLLGAMETLSERTKQR